MDNNNIHVFKENVITKDDTPGLKGIVRLYDNDGNIVFEKHNMIVYGGRKLIFDLFLKNIKLAGEEKAPSHTLYLVFGYNTSNQVTKQFNTFEDFFNTTDSTYKSYEVTTENAEIISEEDVFDESGTVLSLTVTQTINGNETFQKFNQFGFAYRKDGASTENNPVLFSRVAIDPVYIGVDGKYTIKYSIYF